MTWVEHVPIPSLKIAMVAAQTAMRHLDAEVVDEFHLSRSNFSEPIPVGSIHLIALSGHSYRDNNQRSGIVSFHLNIPPHNYPLLSLYLIRLKADAFRLPRLISS
jgi:hypothetical protein